MLGNEVSRLSGTRRGRGVCGHVSYFARVCFPGPNARGSDRKYPRGDRRLSAEPEEAWRPGSLRAFSKRSLRSPADEVAGVSGSQTVGAFRKIDYEFDEQHGSHMILRHADPPHRRLSVPNHKELAKGTLRALIREAGLTVEEFAELL